MFFPPENDIAIDEIYCAELEQVPSSREPITDVEVIANREPPYFQMSALIARVRDAEENLWQTREHLVSRLAQYFQDRWRAGVCPVTCL